MANLVTWIASAVEEELVEAVVIGELGWLADEEEDRIPLEKKGVPLAWSEARTLLDYEFSDEYGSPECHAVFVWTATKVLFIHEYDGSTSLHWVPRHPVPCTPGYA